MGTGSKRALTRRGSFEQLVRKLFGRDPAARGGFFRRQQIGRSLKRQGRVRVASHGDARERQAGKCRLSAKVVQIARNEVGPLHRPTDVDGLEVAGDVDSRERNARLMLTRKTDEDFGETALALFRLAQDGEHAFLERALVAQRVDFALNCRVLNGERVFAEFRKAMLEHTTLSALRCAVASARSPSFSTASTASTE